MAEAKIANGPLFRLLQHAYIHCNDDYPMAKDDWAYVTSTAGVYLNPRRTASVGEWEYIISHCLLHLGFGHISQERQNDIVWNQACDYIVDKFLKDSHIGSPPPEFQAEYPCVIKDEEQVYAWLKEHPEIPAKQTFSTMTHGRLGMRWERDSRIDFTVVFARSLQESMKDALRVSTGLPPQRQNKTQADSVHEARDWFISSYPLLGALAASFRIVDDWETVHRMGISVAAICPQLQEIYINPYCKYNTAEWRFILAHEYLHAALRHDDGAARDAFFRNALRQGLAYHEEHNRGYLPASLIEEIHAIDRPPIRWDVELAKWFDAQFAPLEIHRTYSRMSRRQSSCPDIPRPAWHQPEDLIEQRIFGVLLDTSGSMDRSLLAAALGSIASYSEARDVKSVRVVFCDAAPYDQGIMHPDEIAGNVKVRGRGGTVLQPGIDLLDNDPKFPKDAPLLIITDGMCDRLVLHGRKHAFLIPNGRHLPFVPKGPVFRLR